MMPSYQFPERFVWGVAASAYQIEGAVDADGRGRSVWDEFCDRPGNVAEGQSGRVACDHYHRWKEDLDLIQSLGFTNYRFSVAWPRILPEGRGAVNKCGLDFYDRLVDGLLTRGIEPMACLHHWDLPLALERAGGWPVRATAEAFGEYAGQVARRLGDRVKQWAPFNEIPCIIWEGYQQGTHAPGRREPERVSRQVAHHLLLAHGLAAQAVRAAAPRPVEIGIIHNSYVPLPFSEREADVAAARARFIERNAWLLDPIFKGAYPEEEWRRLGSDAPETREGDLETIAQPLDFCGKNFYTSWDIASADWGVREVERHFPRTFMDWPIAEDGIYWLIRFTSEVYGPQRILITENGCGYPDAVNREGRVEDYARIQYLRSHLRMVHRAIVEGYPVEGYYVWSLLDNFEWSYGYAKRFGLTHVNFETQRRIPKASARWIARVIEDNGL